MQEIKKRIQRGCRQYSKKVLALLCALLIFSSMLGVGNPAGLQAAETSITITGNGLEAKDGITLTLTELQELEQVRQIYSGNNTFPTKKLTAAEGVLLRDLLELAGGLKEDAKSIDFYSGGASFRFSVSYLLGEERYYYPEIMTDSKAGQEVIEPMIALLSDEADNFDHINSSETPRLCYGQRALSEQTHKQFAKKIDRIEVTTEDRGQSAMPVASVTPGNVEMGTEVSLLSYDGLAKIYYTTDGSTPDLNSKIFNVSDFSVNPPLKITEDTTIKAWVYSFYQEPSEVAVFEYKIASGSVQPVVGITEPAIAQTYYPGNEVVIKGTALNLDEVEISVSGPGGEDVFRGTEAVAEGQFGTSLTLDEVATLGVYTISVQGKDLAKPETVTFQVKEDSSNLGGPNDGTKPDQIINSWSYYGDSSTKSRTISWRIKKGTNQISLSAMRADQFTGVDKTGRMMSYDYLTRAGNVTDLDAEHSRVTYNLQTLAYGLGSEIPPGTRLVAQVGGSNAWSEPFFFTSAPADNTAPFSFMFMGDIQEGYGQWGKMVRDAYVANPDLRFALLSGDMVNDGNDANEWSQFFAAATPVFQELGLFTAPGNHDNTDLYYNSFALQGNGPEGFKKQFYSFNYGNAHFTMLNSGALGAPGDGKYEVISEWLKKDLKNSGRNWKFVVMHDPPYPAREKGVLQESLQENWVPVFEECGVDMALVGDHHVYMRTQALKGGQIQEDPAEGIVYVMGNAGTKYYEPEEYPYMAKVAANTSTYQTIKLDGLNLTLQSMNVKGEVIDSLSYSKKTSLNIATPSADSVYLPGEVVKITGTSPDLMSFNYRLLGPDGQEIRSGTIKPGIDGTISANMGLGREYAEGAYVLEFSADGVEETVGIPITVAAALRISGDGITTPYMLSYEDLKAMEQIEADYSMAFRNTKYNPITVEGVRLETLLERAGIKPEAQLVRFKLAGKVTKGDEAVLTMEELFEQPRYSYPAILQGSNESQQQVESLISLRGGKVNNATVADNDYWFNLILGQRALNDENIRGLASNSAEAVGVKEIEVLSGTLEQAAPPQIYPPGTSVTAGTTVDFYHPDEADSNEHVTIYYTTDGSKPSYASYTGKSNSTIIRPQLTINSDTTIRAIAYVNGKKPSEVITYHYTLSQDTNNDPVIYTPVKEEMYRPGDTVSVVWNAVLFNNSGVDITVTDSKGEIVYSVTELKKADAGLYGNYGKCDFTLPADAANGEYQITLKYTKYAAKNIRTFQVGSAAEAKYQIMPNENPAYEIGTAGDGVTVMTVNSGYTGQVVFDVQINSVTANTGSETVVFVHERKGVCIGVEQIVDDYDEVDYAQAGFDVIKGDVIKVFMMDQLTNALDSNPIMLQ